MANETAVDSKIHFPYLKISLAASLFQWGLSLVPGRYVCVSKSFANGMQSEPATSAQIDLNK